MRGRSADVEMRHGVPWLGTYDLGQASVTRERLLFVPAAAAAALLGHSF